MVDPYSVFSRELLSKTWTLGEFSGGGEPSTIPERLIALEHPKAHRLITGMLMKYGLLLQYVKKGKVLDLCCGSGFGASFLALNGLETTAVDAAGGILDISARKRPNISVVHQNVAHLHMGVQFDAVTLVDAIEHFLQENQPLVMRAIVEHLKPGGYALIDTPLVNTSHRQSSKHVWVLNWKDLGELVQKAGLQLVDRYTMATFREQYPILVRTSHPPVVHTASDQILIARKPNG